MEPRQIVIVSGPPASGKTTIAGPLAEALGFVLLSKDDIKESIFTSMDGPKGDVLYSRRIGDAAMHLLWELAPRCPQVVLEANFRTQGAQERERVAALIAFPGTRLVEVFCRVPLEEAARRFAERAQRERHHPAHALREMPVEQMALYSEPFALGSVIEVDTIHRLDLEGLLARVRSALAAEPASLAGGR